MIRKKTSKITCKKCGYTANIKIPKGIDEKAFKNSLKCSECERKKKKQLKKELLPYTIGAIVMISVLILMIFVPNWFMGKLDEKNVCEEQGKIWNTDTFTCFNTKKDFCNWEMRNFGRSMCSAGYWNIDD